jgi:hypothetical protein
MPDKVETARMAINTAVKIAEKYDVKNRNSIIYSRSAEDSILATAEDLKCDVIAIAQDNQRLRILRIWHPAYISVLNAVSGFLIIKHKLKNVIAGLRFFDCHEKFGSFLLVFLIFDLKPV